MELAYEFLVHRFLEVGTGDLALLWRKLFPTATLRFEAERRLESLLQSGHSIDLAKLGIAAAASRNPQFAHDFSRRLKTAKKSVDTGRTVTRHHAEPPDDVAKAVAVAAGCVLLQPSGAEPGFSLPVSDPQRILKDLIPVPEGGSRPDRHRRNVVIRHLSRSATGPGGRPDKGLMAVADFVSSSSGSAGLERGAKAVGDEQTPSSGDDAGGSDRKESGSNRDGMDLAAESGPSMAVNQWITDGAGKVNDMESPLTAGRKYTFWFEIAGEAREGAHSEAFIPPKELQQDGGVEVEVEVRSTLLMAEEGYLRRPTRYLPGQGIKAVDFPLFAEAGQHWLRVNLLHEGRPVYSHSWRMEAKASAGDPQEPKPKRLASLPAGYLSQGAMSKLRATEEVYDNVTLEIPGLPPLRGKRADRDLMVNLAAKARTTLTEFSQRHDPDAKGALSWEEVWAALVSPMIDWGREAAQLLLGPSRELKLIPRLLELEMGSRIHIDSSPGSFPWEWLFLDESYFPDKPPATDPEIEQVLGNFLGCRFRVEVLPYGDHDRRAVVVELDNPTGTVVFSAVNASADQTAAPLQVQFAKTLRSWKSVQSEELRDGSEIIDHIKKALQDANESCHLLYIFAHHRPGSAINQFGYYDFGDSTLYLKGKNQDPLTRRDIQNRGFAGRPFMPARAPLIFLNACGTAAGGDYFPSALLPFFALSANAPAVLGTVADINALAAHQFSKEFIPRWLEGTPAATVLAEIRREWLFQKRNPYGLYYTICGAGEARLLHPAKRTQP